MKKISVLLGFILLSYAPATSQTQAEIDKMMKDAKAEIERFKKDPKNAEMARIIPNLESVKTTMAKGDNNSAASLTLPARNKKLLSSLPKGTLSRQQLITFISSLHADLQKKLLPAKVKAAQTIIAKLNNNAAKIALVGTAAWYKNAPSEAALLLTYAASQSPDDITLNNCGAILNLCGLENKAIPLLKYVLANQPTNSTVLNNIGQAYTGLGATDTAMYYFMRCIKQASSHPEACATVAYIEYEKGNFEKAQQYAEQAIKGGYGATIAKFYRHIKKDAKLYSLLENNLSEKKYFDFNGLTLPPNCRNWEQSEEVYPKQQSFLKKIDGLQKQFEQLIIQNTATNFAGIKAMNVQKGPLATVAQELKSELSDLYIKQKTIAHSDYVNKLVKSVSEEGNDRMALVNKYIPLFKAAEKNPEMYARLIHQKCLDQVALDNKIFEIRANRIDKYKDAWLEKEIKYYNNIVFLTTLTAPNENIFKVECAFYATTLLSNIKLFVLDNVNPKNKPDCCKSDPTKTQDSNLPVFDQAKCPIDIEVPFGVGKMMLNCKRFEFEIGEGIILTYEKNFISRESTVALGLGVVTHIPYTNVGGYKPVDFGVKEQFYIKFDKNNQPIDVGILWEAEMDFKGLATPEFKTGYTLGINSGYNFQPGALQGILK